MEPIEFICEATKRLPGKSRDIATKLILANTSHDICANDMSPVGGGI